MISPDHAAFPVRHDLTIPTHPELIGALGRLAMAYIHLDIVLKYTFKTLSGMSVKDALDQMQKNRTSFVRKRIRRLFSDKQPDPEDLAQLEALLDDAKTVSP